MNNFYEYLEKLDITPNAFHLLWCISNSKKVSVVNPWVEARLLKLSELIDDQHQLTEKGKQILSEGESLIYTKTGSKVKSKIVIEDLDQNVEKYLSFFPLGKLPNGKPARAPKKSIADAFTWFFRNNDYTWDVVLRATAYYVDFYEKNKYMFMRNSQYFIRKQNTDKSWDSDLAGYCEIIINGANQDSNTIHEKVV